MTVTFRRVDSNNPAALTDTGVIGQHTAISPVSTNEPLTEDVLRRPTDNLRVRTEELSRAVTSVEYLLQSVSNASSFLRYIHNAEAIHGLLKVYSKSFSSGNTLYYIAPEIPDERPGSHPSMLVIGSATNSFNYIINKAALEAYYNQGTVENAHNEYLGMKDVGDSICLRIPTVSASYSSEALLPRTTSSLDVAGNATINSNLATAIAEDFITQSEATYSFLKIPAKNSITISPQEEAVINFLADQANKVDLVKADSDQFAVKGINSDLGTESPLVYFDLNGLEDLGSGTYRLPRAGYRDLEDLSAYTSWQVYLGADQATVVETLLSANISFPEDTMLPKNEYLYPLCVFTGDAILLPGLGGVDVIDITTRGGEALVDGSGIVIGETGTATKEFHTRFRITHENLSTVKDSSDPSTVNGLKQFEVSEAGYHYFRVPIDTYIPESGTGNSLYLKRISLQSTLNEVYTGSAGLTLQQQRDVYISVGLFDLVDDKATFMSSVNSFSLVKCVPTISSADFEEGALSKLILTNFRLSDLKDDQYAEIKLTESIKSSLASGLNKRLIVWVYRQDSDKNDFFTNTDLGDMSVDFEVVYTTRLPDSVNVGSDSDLASLTV